jgi:hypothetical protein
MNNAPQEAPFAVRPAGSRVFFAGFLILAGTLLFLGNLGILPIRNIWSYWPVIVVVLGVSRMLNGPDRAIRLFGALVTFLGALFLLINLDLIHIRSHDGSWPVSILLIALGMAMLIKVLDKRDPGAPVWTGLSASRFGEFAKGFNDFTVMGSVKRRVETADYRGGGALSVLGSIELDLRHARMTEPAQTIFLEVSSILGAAKIRVPENWRVHLQGASILGTYEDKRIPPNVAADAPVLVITGFSFMSAVEIED